MEFQLEFAEYGDKDGKLIVYFHGAPGSMEECSLFDSHAKDHNLRIICFDRFAIDHSADRESYYQQLAHQIKNQSGTESVDLIGFSIGAHVALEVGSILNKQIGQTHLVSPAVPINSGDFIDHMAGGLVFKLAMKYPLLFKLLTYWQRIMAIIAPQMLVSMLFASATGEDKILSNREDFKRYITPVLKHCFQNRTMGYIRDINYYITWPGNLSEHSSNVFIWHGVEDNWSPFSMASYLDNAILGATNVEPMEGLSHYSCLYKAAAKICKQLDRS
jgi:pimeloyl-ACP methyl ester carboxylesterase